MTIVDDGADQAGSPAASRNARTDPPGHGSTKPQSRRTSRATRRPPPINVVDDLSPAPPQLIVSPAAGAVGTESEEDNEAADNVGELAASPHTQTFSVAIDDDGASPGSSWSMDSTRRPVPSHRPPSWHRQSLEVPSFLPTTPASPERRFDPALYYKGGHTRSLSHDFPHPGAPPRPISPVSPGFVAGDSVIPSADPRVFAGGADWSFGAAPPDSEADTGSPVKRGKRRGHHHKHSLSHNFFSFLEPGANGPPSERPPSVVDEPTPVPMPYHSTTTTILSPLPRGKRNGMVQLMWAFAIGEALLGASLWIEGQMSGWRCLEGAGYLVVFDALGMVVNIVASNDEDGWRSLRRPFGWDRLTSLLCFAQSLFLMFAAVYISKESFEQVLLGADAHDEGGGGGGHGHGHGHAHIEHIVGEEPPFPYVLLLLSCVASLLSGAFLNNHRRLSEATGSLFLPSAFSSAKLPEIFGNPYTIGVAGTTAALLVSSLITPLESLHGLDSSSSVALTVLIAALAWPPTKAFANVLLQTAPPTTSSQMTVLRRALRDVEDDRRVLGIGTLRCWALSTDKVEPDAGGTNSAPASRRPSISSSPSHSISISFTAPLTEKDKQPLAAPVSLASRATTTEAVPIIVTVNVHVHPDATDTDVLEITRLTSTKISNAVGPRIGGEVTVQVQKGWEGEDGH